MVPGHSSCRLKGQDFFLPLAHDRAGKFSLENRTGKVLGLTPVQHHEREVTALDHPGGNDVEYVIGTCSKPCLADDVQQFLWCEGIEPSCFLSFFGSAEYIPSTEVTLIKTDAPTRSARTAATASVVWPGVIPPITTIFPDSANFFASAWDSATFGYAVFQCSDEQVCVQPGDKDTDLIRCAFVNTEFSQP